MSHQTPDTLEDLLLKVAAADEYAFGKLFNMYHNQLGAFILRITECETQTKEIVQDVFLKIWINRTSLPKITCFKAYLYVVAKNHAFNCLKQIAREKNRKNEWINEVLHTASGNVEEAPAVDAGKLIDAAVALLPPQQKKVYTLSRVYEMKQVEIARELNISLETVKKHMVLALKSLKNHLRTHIEILLLFIAIIF